MKHFFILASIFLNLFAFDAFISPCELKISFEDKNLIIVDVDSKSIYKKGHISNAVHADISAFLDKDAPYVVMNSPDIIQQELQKLGINSDSDVVIYSHNTDDGILNSSYFAFVLISHGFENVSILDGGYMAWVFEFPLLNSAKKRLPKHNGTLIVNKKSDFFADLNYVKENIGKIKMLDSRSPQQYYGIKRSKDIKSVGHIPLAQSSYYINKFLTDGKLRKSDDLNKIFIEGYELDLNEEIIVYGDNALVASMNWYILYKKMGFKKTKIYEASLLEWGNTERLPMIKFKWE